MYYEARLLLEGGLFFRIVHPPADLKASVTRWCGLYAAGIVVVPMMFSGNRDTTASGLPSMR